jgi:hypothetical protein
LAQQRGAGFNVHCFRPLADSNDTLDFAIGESRIHRISGCRLARGGDVSSGILCVSSSTARARLEGDSPTSNDRRLALVSAFLRVILVLVKESGHDSWRNVPITLIGKAIMGVKQHEMLLIV